MTSYNMIAIAIQNLRGLIKPGNILYLSKEDARKRLTRFVTVDFGFDADAWEKWYREFDRGEHFDQIILPSSSSDADVDKP